MKIFSFIKKLFSLVIMIILINAPPVQAQSESGFGININAGIRAGITLPALTIDYQPYTNLLVAPVAGGYFQVKFLPWMAVSIDVLYTQYGGNQIDPLWIYAPQSPALIDLQSSQLVIHSVEFPLAVKIGLPNWTESVSPFFSIGGSMAIFTQARIYNQYLDDSFSIQPIRSQSTELVSSAINSYDYALLPGMGVDFNTESFSFTLELFYRLGLSAVNSYKNLYSTDFGASAFGVKIGIGMNL